MSIDTSFVEYTGINTPTCDFNELITFKEFTISEILQLPEDNCSISNILKTSVDVKILKKKLFKTPLATSVEGQVLTGSKLGIEGEINTVVTYISDDNSINALNYKYKFYVSTPIPSNIKSTNGLLINVYVESINIQKLNDYSLSENLVLLLAID